MDDGNLWVLKKNGYFYRPNARGYTACLEAAGRWPKQEALEMENDDPFCTVTAHRVEEEVA